MQRYICILIRMSVTHLIFKRVPGGHPRWHQVGEVKAPSRPAALRSFGIPAPPRQDCVSVCEGHTPEGPGMVLHAGGWQFTKPGIKPGLYLAWRADSIDFDYKAMA
jgi:hypothetical protein